MKNRDIRGIHAIAFGRVLRRCRKERGLSQEDIASLGDFDRTYPSLLERGKRLPTLSVIFRLADTMRMSAKQLVDEVQDELKKEEYQKKPEPDNQAPVGNGEGAQAGKQVDDSTVHSSSDDEPQAAVA